MVYARIKGGSPYLPLVDEGNVAHYAVYIFITSVPLATKPGISLIILTPMKILQRNLNRSTFVVREMKRNVSVMCVCSVCL